MNNDDDDNGIPDDLDRLLAEAAELVSGHMRRDPIHGPDKSAQDAMNLKEIYARFARGNPYKPGDLVTPRRGFNIRDAGAPCIVLETFDTPITPEVDREQDGLFHKNDMRIMRIMRSNNSEDAVTFLAESLTYEPYTGEIMSADPDKVH
jgi:hypothetical protein